VDLSLPPAFAGSVCMQLRIRESPQSLLAAIRGDTRLRQHGQEKL
jgi:hypothetical protein